MKVLMDTDVVLDFFLARSPFVTEAIAIWKANRAGQFEGFVSAITPVNLFYIGGKARGATQARQAVADLLAEFKVCPVDRGVLEAAHLSSLSDYEDAVQVASALNTGLDALVTRNLKDYAGASLPVYAPADFLAHLSSRPPGTTGPGPTHP